MSGSHWVRRPIARGSSPAGFGGEGYSAAKRDLAAVLIDGVGLGETQLWFLKSRWLESQHAIAADPGPPGNADGLFDVNSRSVAVGVQHVIAALPRITLLALLALATALIYGLIGRINLAIGEFAAMGGILMTLAVGLGTALGGGAMPAEAFAFLGVIAITGLWGAAVGTGMLEPLARRGGQPILVAGVGLMVFVQEGLRLAQGARTAWLAPVGAGSVPIGVGGGFEIMLNPRAISLVVMHAVLITMLLIFLRKSRYGMAWRAMAQDPFAAAMMGLDARFILLVASVLATMLAGLAGASVALLWGGMNFSGGTTLGLTGLIAAILGGIGSLGGAVLAAITIGALQAIWMALRPIEHWELATFTLLSVFLVMKPDGFFGYRDAIIRPR
jgi:branched-subunit amino acid ABC-type transport system permease component